MTPVEYNLMNEGMYDSIGGFLEVGNYFGELSLLGISKSDYNRNDQFVNISLIAQEPTVIISIDRKDFLTIFDSNPTYLTELRVRLLGNNVELDHVISHRLGYISFFNFLEKEFASEGLLFWKESKSYVILCTEGEKYIQDIVNIYKSSREIDTYFPDDNNSVDGTVISEVTEEENDKDSIPIVCTTYDKKQTNKEKFHHVNKIAEHINSVMISIIDTFIIQGSKNQVLFITNLISS